MNERKPGLDADSAAYLDEDLPAIAARAYELALQHCGRCVNYHVYWPMRRLAGVVGGSDADRALVGKLIAGLLDGAGGDVNVLVAGAADTGTLASAANGVFMAGGRELVDRTRFTVVDRCRTPLQLCLEYGGSAHLRVATACADLAEYEPAERFSAILVHSTLAFLQEQERAPMIRRLIRWLEPEGRIVLSANMAGSDDTSRDKSFDERTLPMLIAAIAAGRLRLCEDEARFLDRCRRRHDGIDYDRRGLRDISEVYRLAEEAGAKVEVARFAGKPENRNDPFGRQRIAVLLAPDGA